ncbi:MAG: toprim domain-containing protein [Candidatus Cloacimonetes bacterium]|jgi:hypothetical protein|nr:toprim domain-containing protein [Candidatus Cloacimonadota bacterium]
MNISIPPDKISAWVYKNFPDCKPRKNGDELRVCNPFDGDTGYHFNISCVKGYAHDWRGDASWVGYNPNTGKLQYRTFLRFVQSYLTQKRGSCSFPEAVQEVLGASSGVRALFKGQRARLVPESKETTSLALPEGTAKFDESKSKLVIGLLAWLGSRGVDDRKIKKYKIMYNGLNVVWPYYEYDDLVYWQSRSRINKVFRFPPENVGVTKGQFFYGFDQVEPASYVVITESIFVCLTLEDQCLATGGASMTNVQVKKLKLLGPKDGIILSPDNDKAGIESILHNASILQQLNYKIYYALPPIVKLPDGKMSNDWNDLVKVADSTEIRKTFEASIKPFSIQQRLYLENRLKQFKMAPKPKLLTS